VLAQLSKAPVEKVSLGFRPLPADSHPIVGFPEGRRDIYLTVMHSGITLGPAHRLSGGVGNPRLGARGSTRSVSGERFES
jgi:hypothetical protein